MHMVHRTSEAQQSTYSCSNKDAKLSTLDPVSHKANFNKNDKTHAE